MKWKALPVIAGALCVMVNLWGCETTSVNAWERGLLARPEMAWEPDPMQAILRDHIHTAKEGAAGGVGTGGGGCGCY